MEKDYDAPVLAWRDAVTYLRDLKQSHKAIDSFREAARGWDNIRRVYGHHTYSLLWLGYSYHAAGDLPHAIAAYRSGLALDPTDAKFRTALAYARAQVQYPPAPELARVMQPEPEYWPPWLALRTLGVYAFGLYFAACLAATRWCMTRRRRWLAAAGLALALAAVPAVGSGVEWLRRRHDAAEPVVVLARDCPLRVGNGPDYPPRLDAPLPRGAEVRRLFERSGWVQVELSGGPVGWLPRDAVVMDDPG
jgi:tetratricopeptide (TPR) repeat protein